MKKLFVWDFHGTLEKGNEHASREITNNVLAKRGYKRQLTKSETIKLYGKKWYEYYEYLLPNESHQTHVKLQAESFEWPTAEAIVAKHIKPNDHSLEVVQTIHAAGHPQLLLSNTATYALPIFVRLAGLSDYFTDQNAIAISAHVRDVVTTKQMVMERYMAEHNLEHHLVVIGDSLKDIELAKREDAKGYLYRHPGLELEAKIPANVTKISDLREVLAELN